MGFFVLAIILKISIYMKSLKEKTIQSRSIYKGKLLDIRNDEVCLPNGKIGNREWINHPGAACCLPILGKSKIVLTRQYRYAVGEESIEIPAGKLDKDETPEECASRELKEETGFIAKKITPLTSFYPAIGFANEKIWIFLAQNLKKDNTNTDDDEFVETFSIDFESVLDMLYQGMIKDSKTIIALMWLEKHMNKFRLR